jgi:hypothetical protein
VVEHKAVTNKTDTQRANLELALTSEEALVTEESLLIRTASSQEENIGETANVSIKVPFWSRGRGAWGPAVLASTFGAGAGVGGIIGFATARLFLGPFHFHGIDDSKKTIDTIQKQLHGMYEDKTLLADWRPLSAQ